MSHPNLLNASHAVLLVVDIQDPLLRVIHEAERVVENAVRLVEAAKVFSLPVLVTVQYPEKLGDCTGAVLSALPEGTQRLPKTSFSCVGCEGFVDALKSTGRGQAILCGLETHVCVSQTAHDLLHAGWQVHVVKDAVSSRTPENWMTGVEKMRDSGCIITSTEAAIFELTRDASTAEFKKILPIVK